MASEQHELDTLDVIIVDVARQMTAGEPGAAFTSNVLARLDARASGPSWIGRYAWLVAAAVIVVAVFVFTRGSRPGGVGGSRPGPFGPGTETGPRRPALPIADQAGGSRPGPFGPGIEAGPNRLRQGYGGPPKRSAKAEGPALRVAALQVGNQIPSIIDALATPRLTIERLDAAALAPMDSLDMDPLTIAPLTVTPLEIVDSGDDIQRRFE
jgi:hypothetical protein